MHILNIEFRPPFSDIQGRSLFQPSIFAQTKNFDPPFPAPIDFWVSQVPVSLPTNFTEGTTPQPLTPAHPSLRRTPHATNVTPTEHNWSGNAK